MYPLQSEYAYPIVAYLPSYPSLNLPTTSYRQEALVPNRIDLKDYGPQPFVVNIEQAALQNNNYRTAIWTGPHLQVTVMSIPVGDDIGLEVHPAVDQFIRIEQGSGLVQMGHSKDKLDFTARVADGFAVMIPAGTWHNVTNTGRVPMKLYSIYAPPNHPRGTVHPTKADAMAEER